MINTNLIPRILHRFRDIAVDRSKIAIFGYIWLQGRFWSLHFGGASGVAIISARGAWTNIATLNHPELNSYQQT